MELHQTGSKDKKKNFFPGTFFTVILFFCLDEIYSPGVSPPVSANGPCTEGWVRRSDGSGLLTLHIKKYAGKI